MRIFAEKPQATQHTSSPKAKIQTQSRVRYSHDVNSMLPVQYSIGNQTVQPMLQARAEKLAVPHKSALAFRFAQDCGQIPASPAKTAEIQAKLSINKPGDEYEQEADRVADQVMRMSERVPTCQRDQPRQEPMRMQTARLQAGNKEQIEAPPDVHDVIASPGQPLDSATREYMEPRFGWDFSRVRIHSDAKAAASAEAVNAVAYTVGHNIVFGERRYNPSAPSGRQLLAHELTHVLQQEGRALAVQRTPADPCTYAGGAVKDREVHLNLSLNAVRVYERGSGHTQFNNLITGPATRSLARANGWCHMYSVKGHQRQSSIGLINFVNYCGEFGFHSNFWRKRRVVSRIPGTVSHGCARLHDADERSTATGDSNRFFNLVRDRDCVRLYSQSFWRQPTFRRCPSNGEDCNP